MVFGITNFNVGSLGPETLGNVVSLFKNIREDIGCYPHVTGTIECMRFGVELAPVYGLPFATGSSMGQNPQI